MSRRSLAVATCLLVGAAVARADGTNEADHGQVDAFLAAREANLRSNAQVTPEFWPWLVKHPDIRAALLVSSVKPLHAENLDALRQAVTPAQAETYAHLLLAAALRDTEVKAPQGKDDRSGVPSRAEIEGVESTKGAYPRRVVPSVIEQVKAQIARQEAQVATKDGLHWPLMAAKAMPYYLLHPLTCEVSLREQDFIWQRFTNPETKPDQRLLTYGSSRYGWEYTKPEIRTKKSAWEPDSIPRILEDGGVCGRLARMEATGKATLGIPAATAGQPGHCALVFLEQDKDGNWQAQIGQAESGGWFNTTPHAPLGLTSSIAGFEHDALAWAALAETANRVKMGDCLDSLAWFEMSKEAKAPETKAQFLDKALSANPFHLAAWMARAEMAPDAEDFSAVMLRLSHAMAAEGTKVCDRRIAQLLASRLVAKKYRVFLADAAGEAQMLAAMRRLLDALDDDGTLFGQDVWPLYLRHAAKRNPDEALDIANANLERALLGSIESVPYPECLAVSPTWSAIKGIEAVAGALPKEKRAQVLAEAGEKLAAVYPKTVVREHPVLEGGKTVFKKTEELQVLWKEWGRISREYGVIPSGGGGGGVLK